MTRTESRKARILIADDQFEIRSLLHDLLSDDYECVAVASAEEALSLLAVEAFDLVLSDIRMGGMSGLEMVPALTRCAPDTVVIMVSGEQTVEKAIEALRVGAFDYVTKPFDLRHIEAAVRRALEHHSLRIAKRRHESYLEELIKQRTEEVDHLSYHDGLTDLPNRILFEDRLAQALHSVPSNGQLLAVMLLDVDRFKLVNDTLGHVVGDRLLRGVGERLSGCVRAGDTVARFGSDEFALLTQLREDDAAEMFRHVLEVLKRPFRIDEHELYVTLSAGISLSPTDGVDAQTLLRNAGSALHRAKEQEGNNYQIYTADMSAQALQHLALENSLRQALGREEFMLHYQPQVCIPTGRIVGMEALVRWQHPERGLVSPGAFIPVAENSGLIVPLGEWILRTACSQNMKWQETGMAPLRVSVNLSPRQFRQPNLVEMVDQTLRETGMAPQFLELEITETSMMRNVESAIQTLRGLQALGVQIAIDDFGTGYSSLSYLKNFPISTLKIDQSFVRDAVTDRADAAIVKTIIALGHSLELTVKAEGVETEEQLEFLRRLECDEMQGYLFSKPLPPEAFHQRWLASLSLDSQLEVSMA
ncbi:MAG: EAL domain-containing protein [Pyrinomonadaceae bacterium]|nr:EAL domain-containing protein [Pyrinomonadaceae bacterium]MDQ3135259.1 EAL domain-containing protein [Acidobacteriota bacterium]